MEAKNLKTLYYIHKKQELRALYMSQMSEQEITDDINHIIRSNGKSIKRHNLTDRMVLQFIKLHGTPSGYVLSEELKLKLKEV